MKNTQKITPFLWFETGAREAAKFYLSVFGENAKIEDESKLDDTPSGTVEIFTIQIFNQEFTLMTAGPFQKFNESISFVISCDTQEEVDHYWNSLSAVPESEQCGWLKDKFGVSWQVVPTALGRLMGDSDREKAGKVQQAMLKMKKLVIKDLEDAFNQI
ncbi:MAG: VOC family protein [Candidatus Pacebacteria bacterium]|nr:VOC family protein [Candidatus Paceibacterota bacterium]